MALQLSPPLAYAPNPDAVVVQVTQVQLSISAPSVTTTAIHKSKGLTPELKAQLEAIAAMPDDTIDLSDMPEVKVWSGWTRGKFYRPVKKQATLRLDADVLEWFKS